MKLTAEDLLEQKVIDAIIPSRRAAPIWMWRPRWPPWIRR